MNEQATALSAKHKDAFIVIRWFAFVLANGRVYGPEHKITRQSVADATRALRAFQQRHGELAFTVADDDFLVEGVHAGAPIASTIALAKCLNGLRAQELTFQQGITAEEVQSFVNMLFLKEEQIRQANGLAGLLTASGLTGIRLASYTYQRVTEGEAVVSKNQVAAEGLAPRAAAAARQLMADAAGGRPPAEAFESANLDSEATIRELARLTAPPDDIDRQGAAALTRQTVDRLQRMTDSLLDVPANRTQKGRKALRKLIKRVEADVTDRLQHLGADIQAVEMLAARVKELVEELAVDGLVAQYMRLRGEIAEKEKRLQRHIQRAEGHGETRGELRSRLTSLGLPAEVLENFRAMAEHAAADAQPGQPVVEHGDGLAGTGAGTSPGGGGADAPPPAEARPLEPKTPLGDLLKRLQKTDPGAGDLPQLVESILQEMNKTLQQTAVRAEAQMETLKRIVMIPAGRPDNADLSRRQLLILMAELGQELRQPLTVCTGAIDMLLGQYFGPVAEEQTPILQMAAESNRNLDELISRMIRIAGMPTSLNPDENILARIKARGDA